MSHRDGMAGYDEWKTTDPRSLDGSYDPEPEDEECYQCGGEGWIMADCFEDTCCCADPEEEHDYIPCPVCSGIRN